MADRPPVGYLVSRFPKLTETFILYEILAVEALGQRVELFPLLRARATSSPPEGQSLLRKIAERVRPEAGPVVMHAEAVPLVERAHYTPFLSRSIVAANWRAFRRRPARYLRALARVVDENLGSPNFLVGGLAIFPKAVAIGEQMRELGVTHVHAHFANHPATAAWIIGTVTGIPYSFTGHGADLQVDQHMLGRKVRDAQAVITISEYNRAFIGEHAGAAAVDKVTVIHCGVDTARFAPRESPPRSDGSVEALCIGTFYEVKGHRYLIEAMRILKDRGRSVRLTLVGEGPDEAALRELAAREGVAELITFAGPRTRDEVLAHLRAADLLVVPSIPTESGRREGIPVVLMEAMASGVPVVASGISGIPELVEDGTSGLLVPPKDPPALAAAIERIADDPRLALTLSAGGRARVEAEFDLERNAARLLTTIGAA
jgi:glycosyltransferase involved in cell wall biosynthesis